MIIETERDLSPKTVEMLHRDIAAIGDVKLTPLSTGPDQPTVYMLTSERPPDPRSHGLHPEFLRVRVNPDNRGSEQ